MGKPSVLELVAKKIFKRQQLIYNLIFGMQKEMRKKLLPQSDISEMRLLGLDLGPRWQEVLEEVVSKTGFFPDRELLRKSEWWRTGKIGAVHCPGFIEQGDERVRAVLKIQGTKPATSEAVMIKAFDEQDKSKIIRPPKIFLHLPWDKEKQYEAVLMEEVQGRPVITRHPATGEELDKFFEFYIEYRTNCRSKPWVAKPGEWSYREQVRRWRAATEKQYQADNLKELEDEELAEKGIEIIEKNLSSANLEFVHGHFQPGDLILTNDGSVVLFSNLFWSWRIPFYDAVFGYHWWMLGMEHAQELTPELLEKERQRWLEKIYALPQVKSDSKNKRLVTLALLERAVPALMVDRFMLDADKPAAVIITEGTRRELKRLIKELS